MGIKKIDRYEIRAEIGRGGMATVYRAYDPHFDREVAIKVLPAALMYADESFRLRFEREVKTIAALEHGAVVSVYDYGEIEGQPFYVMRLMDGGSLADRIRGGIFSVAEAAQILTRLAPALDTAHAQGIVHRDLKPGNILFDRHNDVYLSDFGIAKLIQSAATLTGSNTVIGTPAYMSPEQGRGETDIDGRSDIYSLGAVTFEMLSGRVPYEADTPTGQIIKHITEPIPNILDLRSDLDPDCQVWIERAMAKDKNERFENVSEMAKMLENIGQGKALTQDILVTRRTSSHESPARSNYLSLPRLDPKWRTRIGFALVFLVLSALAFWASSHQFFSISRGVPTFTVTNTITPLQTPTPQLSATGRISPTNSATPYPPTSTITTAPTATTTPQPRAIVSVNAVNLRAGPSTIYPIITTYQRGTEVVIMGRNAEGSWLAVQDADGTSSGWITASAVDFTGDLQALVEIEAGPTPTAHFQYSSTPTKTQNKKPESTPVPQATKAPTPKDTEATAYP